jgi:hypothetical protein
MCEHLGTPAPVPRLQLPHTMLPWRTHCRFMLNTVAADSKKMANDLSCTAGQLCPQPQQLRHLPVLPSQLSLGLTCHPHTPTCVPPRPPAGTPCSSTRPPCSRHTGCPLGPSLAPQLTAPPAAHTAHCHTRPAQGGATPAPAASAAGTAAGCCRAAVLHAQALQPLLRLMALQTRCHAPGSRMRHTA